VFFDDFSVPERRAPWGQIETGTDLAGMGRGWGRG